MNLANLFFLASAGAPEGQLESLYELMGTFGVEWRVIFAQALNFIVVAFILWRFAFRPVLHTLDERQEKIAQGLRDAEVARKRLDEAESEKAETLRKAHGESQEILVAARDKARAYDEKMRAETAVQLEEMRKRAEAAQRIEREKMFSDLKEEIARLVVLTSASVLKNELTDDVRKRINDAAAKEVAGIN